MKTRIIIASLIVIALACKGKVPESPVEENSKVKTEIESAVSDLLNEESSEVAALDTLKLTSYKLTSKTCIKCSMEPLITVKKNIGILRYQDLYNFFCTFDDSCSNNVEYVEFSNKMLYKVLTKYPQDVVKILSEEQFDREYILKAISSPLLDYNYEAIMNEIQKAPGDETIKQLMVESIREAIKG